MGNDATGIGDQAQDCKRHGTTTLFAALNVLNGEVLTSCKPRHRHQEFLAFLRQTDNAVTAQLDIHCIADNYNQRCQPFQWTASRVDTGEAAATSFTNLGTGRQPAFLALLWKLASVKSGDSGIMG